MFAIVRSGGKQYRVAPGDKIVVEKLAGEAGDNIDLTDILLAGEGSELKPVAGLKVGARIIAQAKGEKVTVFKKRRRHNYRRKAGHRQQHTILQILSIGDQKATKKAPKAEDVPVKAEPAPVKAEATPAKAEAAPKPAKAEAKPTAAASTKAAKPAAKAAPAPSTKDAASAKGAAKKAAPKAAAKTSNKK